ncbi:hypothetical protein [Cupriavidus taiwanensis]|uniref:hypothetical protein n=1 Tax=Cupriavidus taiwanensis TaxID=164546 RepID=UPI000E16B0EB|nr:hypothetical protein [Cupriavidus taiwanensis]SOY86833.1 Hypothethical protein [Cupriavidus taiwanensis]
MYHYTDSGLKNVWLANGYEILRTPYGKGVAIRDLDGLFVAICIALAKRPSPLTGSEFRYVRSVGLMESQAGLAKLLGSNEELVTRWEASGKVPSWADKLVRLIYLTSAEGNVSNATVIERIKVTKSAEKQRIVLRRARSSWAAKTESQCGDAGFAA